jgi:hypothetical protein
MSEFTQEMFNRKTIASSAYRYESGCNDELVITFTDGSVITIRAIPCNDDTAALKFEQQLMTAFQKGDRVRYRSLAGDVYDATVTGVRGNGMVDLDIDVPGCREPFPATAVPDRLAASPASAPAAETA